MKRYLYKFLFASLMMACVLGCNNSSKLKIGFVYPSDDIIRFNKESKFFKAYANKQGVEVIIKAANNDESLQKEQATQLIEEGIDALVIIAVNVNTAAAIVREATNNDVPVMAYNRMIKNSKPDFFLAGSNDQIGKIMVDAVMEETDGGNFVILGGDKFDKNGEDLQIALNKYLKPHVESGKVNIVYEAFTEQWSDEIAGFEMEKIISLYGTDIDAVIAGFDGMAEAVIEVLKKYGLEGKVAVTGQDAEIRGCKNIVAGHQLVTVFHPLNQLGEKAAEIAVEIARGKSTKDFVNSTEFNGLVEIPTHRVNSIGVTKDNLDKVLIESGFYKREDIY